MNDQVTASEKPAPVSTCRSRLLRAMRGSGRGEMSRSARERGRHSIVPVVARHLFDEVRLPLHVHAHRRHTDAPAVRGVRHVEAQAREDASDLGIVDGGAEQVGDPRATQQDFDRAAGRRVDVDDGSGAASGANLLEQRARALEGHDRRVDVRAALEARGGLRLEAQPPARAPHARGLEVRALECDQARAGPHLGGGAAHHAGDGLRRGRIGDDEHAARRGRGPRRPACGSARRPGAARAQLAPARAARDRRRASGARPRGGRSW